MYLDSFRAIGLEYEAIFLFIIVGLVMATLASNACIWWKLNKKYKWS